MGRPEAPIYPGAPPVLRTFAEGLRALRQEAGLNYRTMSHIAGVSPTALSQAASGNRLPTEAIMTAYVKACGGNIEGWRRQRKAVEFRLQQPERPYRMAAPDGASLQPEGEALPALRRPRRTWETNLMRAGASARSTPHQSWCKRLAACLRGLGYERAGGSVLASADILSGEVLLSNQVFARQAGELDVPAPIRDSMLAELHALKLDLKRKTKGVDLHVSEPADYEHLTLPTVPGEVGARRPELELVALPGEFIRELRRAITISGKSFRELSRESHIPPSTISDLTRPSKSPGRDVRLPSLDLVTRLLKACSVTPLEMTYYEQALRRVQKVELELYDRQSRISLLSEPPPPLGTPVPSEGSTKTTLMLVTLVVTLVAVGAAFSLMWK
ncbi:helix-turn-helix transcriptional regulator [Streptomyces seoulensis]|uniref:helix-turn-helix transcriptional regulator n=1 Tax=Streptomyces seoulensis TaxID=73044 RepID=UPI0033BD6530